MAVETQGVQDETPVSTKGFGARESADETRQAQQSVSNDAPTDVNANAIVARSQALTVDIAGKEWATEAALRADMSKSNQDWREIHKGRLFGAK